jgi:DNA invertase Pin-like site-specific DNA recombinase
VNGEHKITSSHRDRMAVIYLRQSTMAQVREHTESTRSQYALAGTAAALGWPRTSIEVIDTDLGVSGKWGVARQGFTELVTMVCAGEVGAIFGIEITRLARSHAEVARLAEFARITGTLLIDPDGVYDPADVNDRVLLGFKGTMGEMELHVMAQRLQANKRAAAERGELRAPRWSSAGSTGPLARSCRPANTKFGGQHAHVGEWFKPLLGHDPFVQSARLQLGRLLFSGQGCRSAGAPAGRKARPCRPGRPRRAR